MTTRWKHPTMLYPLVVASKGVLSAAEAGAAWGLTRNAVIGIWHRAKAPRLTYAQRHVIDSRCQLAAWARRKAGAQ